MKKKDQTGEEPRQLLEATLKSIEKEFGKGVAFWFDDESPLSRVESIPTGSLYLDHAIGIGGYPKGRIIEIFGMESTGKTSLCLHAIKEAQKKGLVCAFIDMEHGLNKERIEAIGVDASKLIFSQPDCAEDALDIVDRLSRTGEVGVIVLDSVASLVSKKELEGEMGDAHVGIQARLMSQAMRKLAGIASKTKTIIIFTNQIRQKVGIIWGSNEVTSGGLALKFFAALRLRTSTKSANKIKDENGNVVGMLFTVDIIKNKVGPPFKTCDVPFYFDRGISREEELFEIAVESGLIEKSGSWFSYDGNNIAQGKVKAIQWLLDNAEIINQIELLLKGGPEDGV